MGTPKRKEAKAGVQRGAMAREQLWMMQAGRAELPEGSYYLALTLGDKGIQQSAFSIEVPD